MLNRTMCNKQFKAANVCRGIFIFLLLITISGTSYPAGNNSTDTLAVIEEYILTADTFLDSYKSKLEETGLNDNLETRRKYFNNLVNDAILINEARRLKIHKTADAIMQHERIQTQELLNAYSVKHISANVQIDDDELKELFIKLNTKIKVSHIYASTKAEIDSIYRELSHGKSFEQLAYESFDDPVLKNGFGSLGYITIDETDPAFEEVAFKLKPGEISKPVKTVKGFSIVRVEDVKTNPLLTESEYLKARNRLVGFARKRAFEDAAKRFSDDLSRKLNISVFSENLFAVYDFVKSGIQTGYTNEKGIFSQSELIKKAVVSELGEWTVEDVLKELSISTEKQLGWIKTEENFYDYLKGLVNRRYIVEKAIKEGLNNSKEVKDQIEYKFDSYLLTVIEDRMKSDITVSDDEISEHYNKYTSDFTTEPSVRLSLILTDSKESSDKISGLLKEGSDFSIVARDYSIQSLTAVNGGDAGYFEKKDLDYLSTSVFDLEQGEWAGPYEDQGNYVFIKCTDKRPSRLMPIKEVKDKIREELAIFKWYEERESTISSIRNNLDIKLNSEKLIQLKL